MPVCSGQMRSGGGVGKSPGPNTKKILIAKRVSPAVPPVGRKGFAISFFDICVIFIVYILLAE